MSSNEMMSTQKWWLQEYNRTYSSPHLEIRIISHSASISFHPNLQLMSSHPERWNGQVCPLTYPLPLSPNGLWSPWLSSYRIKNSVNNHSFSFLNPSIILTAVSVRVIAVSRDQCPSPSTVLHLHKYFLICLFTKPWKISNCFLV